MSTKLARFSALLAWGSFLAIISYGYFFHANALRSLLEEAIAVHVWWAYLIFFIIGSLRGFTFIPSTYLIVLGLFFFDPLPLYFLVLGSVLVSSALIYKFSHIIRLDKFFEKHHKPQVDALKSALEKRELPVLIGWSFAPFLPTDLICYVCGSLGLNFKKFLLGIFIGEALVCLPYIFGGYFLIEICRVSSWCFL